MSNDEPLGGVTGFEQPKGYISPAESNWNSQQREKKKNGARKRNPNCPRDGFHVVGGLPPWLDGPRVRQFARERGLSYEEAQEVLRREHEGVT